MNRIPFIYKTYHPRHSPKLFGDQIMLHELLSNHIEEYPDIDGLRGAVINIRMHDNELYINKLNEDIRQLEWCLILITCNEHQSDMYKKIEHPNCKIWIQTPKVNDEADYHYGIGYPSQLNKIVADIDYDSLYKDKKLDWFFAGQNTNDRRNKCVYALQRLHLMGDNNTFLLPTEGFNMGLPYEEYIDLMKTAKVVPCPGGPSTPDTFRVYEALEMGCIPVVDLHNGRGDYQGNYWHKIFNGYIPFPVISDWNDFEEILHSILVDYPKYYKRVHDWWVDYKKKLVLYFITDVEELMNN